MSRKYSRVMTLEIEGVEQDRRVEGDVYFEGTDAYLDGEPRVWLPEGAFNLSDLDVSEKDRDRVEEALCEMAFADDSGACVEMYADGTVGL